MRKETHAGDDLLTGAAGATAVREREGPVLG